MSKKAKISVGTPINSIPMVQRKYATTRIDMVRKALNKLTPGQVLPIYTGSNASANSLATLLRKAGVTKGGVCAVRKHIIYVQTPATTGKPELAEAEPTVAQVSELEASQR